MSRVGAAVGGGMLSALVIKVDMICLCWHVCVWGGWGGGCVHTCACMRAGDSVSVVRVFLFQCVSVSLCFL